MDGLYFILFVKSFCLVRNDSRFYPQPSADLLNCICRSVSRSVIWLKLSKTRDKSRNVPRVGRSKFIIILVTSFYIALIVDLFLRDPFINFATEL